MKTRRGRSLGLLCAALVATIVPLSLLAVTYTHLDDIIHKGQEVFGKEPRTLVAKTSGLKVRRMQDDDYDSDYDYEEAEKASDDAAMASLITTAIQLGVLLGICVCTPLVIGVYWKMYMKPTPDKWLRKDTVVPDDLKGKWVVGLCGGDIGDLCCFLLCPFCALADLWYRAGFVHAVVGDKAQGGIQAWQYFASVAGVCIVEDTGCLCCFTAFLRGGMEWMTGPDSSGIVALRKRFEIPHSGFSTFLGDCCVSLWCGPCASAQEYKQVITLLDRNPTVAVRPANQAMPVVVGAPVQVKG